MIRQKPKILCVGEVCITTTCQHNLSYVNYYNFNVIILCIVSCHLLDLIKLFYKIKVWFFFSTRGPDKYMKYYPIRRSITEHCENTFHQSVLPFTLFHPLFLNT